MCFCLFNLGGQFVYVVFFCFFGVFSAVVLSCQYQYK